MRPVILSQSVACRLPKIRNVKQLLPNQSAAHSLTSAPKLVRPLSAAASAAATYEAPTQEPQRQRIFTTFPVYKQKGAFQASVISPTWRVLPQGDYALDRPGTVFFEFAEPQAGTGSQPGERRYDWAKKQAIVLNQRLGFFALQRPGLQSFALSAIELSHIIDPDPNGMKPLVHDPNMKGSNAGSMIKTLTLNKQQDGEGWFIRLMVKSGQQQTSLGVALSKHEFRTLQILSEYAVPHLLGFDQALSQNVNFTHDVRNDIGPPPF